MSIIQTYECDRCGKTETGELITDLNGSPYYRMPTKWSSIHSSLFGIKGALDTNLCDRCNADIKQWMSEKIKIGVLRA